MPIEYAGLKVPVDRRNWLDATRAAARRAGINEEAFVRQIYRESAGFDPDVISGKRLGGSGEVGIAQFMPATAAQEKIDPFDPHASLFGSARLMARYQKKYANYFAPRAVALAAYNAGEGAVAKYGGVPPYPSTIKYIQDVQGPGATSRPRVRVDPNTPAGQRVAARQTIKRGAADADPRFGGGAFRGAGASRSFGAPEGANGAPAVAGAPPPEEGFVPPVETASVTASALPGPEAVALPDAGIDFTETRDLLHTAAMNAIRMGKDEPPPRLEYGRGARIASGISAALDPAGYAATSAEYHARLTAPMEDYTARQVAFARQAGVSLQVAQQMMVAEEEHRERTGVIADINLISQSLPQMLQGAAQVVQTVIGDPGEATDPDAQLAADDIGKEMVFIDSLMRHATEAGPDAVSASTRDTMNRSITRLQNAITNAQETMHSNLRGREAIEGANYRALLSLMRASQKSGKISTRVIQEIDSGSNLLSIIEDLMPMYAEPSGEPKGSEAPGGPVAGYLGTTLPFPGREERKDANMLLKDLSTTIFHLRSGAAWSAHELAELREVVADLTDRPRDVVKALKFIQKRVRGKINVWAKLGGLSVDDIEEILANGGYPEDLGPQAPTEHDATDDLPPELKEQLSGYSYIGAEGY